MRFVLLAFALFGVALFLANPRSFGVGQGIALSDGKSIARIGRPLNLNKVGEFGAEMFDIAVLASNRAIESYEASGNQVYRAVKQPPSYQAQLAAIATALAEVPETSAAHMYDATQSCIEEEGAVAPPQMVNYFSGLVQVVALTADLSDDMKAEQFGALSAPLNEALSAWLKFMPEDARAENQLVLESWASRPKALVACHLEWLNLPE